MERRTNNQPGARTVISLHRRIRSAAACRSTVPGSRLVSAVPGRHRCRLSRNRPGRKVHTTSGRSTAWSTSSAGLRTYTHPAPHWPAASRPLLQLQRPQTASSYAKTSGSPWVKDPAEA